MDWVHCNVCFFQPGQLPKRDFKLTSCGHIFCQCCERSGTIEQCKMCGIKCTTTPLSAQMAKEIQEYFEDPEAVQAKLMKVMEFQKNHRQRLNENYRKLTEKYCLLKVNYQRAEEEIIRLKNELEVFKRQPNINILTPPQPKQQYPLFSQNSQASKAIRKGVSQGSVGTASPALFATPAYSSQQYRNHKMTPTTPMSDASSNSPASISSGYRSQLSVGGSASSQMRASGSASSQLRSGGSANNQQRAYKPGLTPPINSLRLLSFSSQKPRNGARF